MKTMNIKKTITSAIAAVMAAAALATTAGAAEYYGNDGSYWFDGINDGKVYAEDNYGYYYDVDTGNYVYQVSYDNANYCARSDNSYNYISYSNGYTDKYIGFDVYYGNVYYRSDNGYYTKVSGGTRYLGQGFTFTEYVGRDRYGREIYYRNEFGYIYLKGSTWYTLGYNYNNIAW